MFESVCLRDGEILRREYHAERFNRSYRECFGATPPYGLYDGIDPGSTGPGLFKLRIAYGRKDKGWETHPYTPREVRSLRIVQGEEIRYDFKFSDRRAIDRLYEMKSGCDDILIARQGHVTDTSYSNIAFLFQGRWFTPDPPLLGGTHRAALLDRRALEACPIRISEIPEFDGFQLINAMLDFQPDYFVPITQIQL